MVKIGDREAETPTSESHYCPQAKGTDRGGRVPEPREGGAAMGTGYRGAYEAALPTLSGHPQ